MDWSVVSIYASTCMRALSEQHGKCTTTWIVRGYMHVYLASPRRRSGTANQTGRPGSRRRKIWDAPHFHAAPRRARTTMHVTARSKNMRWVTVVRLRRKYFWLGLRSCRIMLKLGSSMSRQDGRGFSSLVYLVLLLILFLYWTLTLFGGYLVLASYLVVSILDHLFYEILTWTSYGTSHLQIRFGSKRSSSPQIVKLLIISQGQGARCVADWT